MHHEPRVAVYKGSKVRAFGHNDKLVTEFPSGYYTTDAFADHAVATMHRFARAGRPFFLHLAFTAPHYPLHAFPEEIAKYRGKYRQGGMNLGDNAMSGEWPPAW